MGVDYVDIFYSHRPDPRTPIEETMAALDQVVRQGKALYAGISSYTAPQTEAAVKALGARGIRADWSQPRRADRRERRRPETAGILRGRTRAD
jgi:L-glyceraldehyde 3-phosphate reductase